MTSDAVFPFGAPVERRAPSREQPAELFVLGAYPSALHVQWTPPVGSGLKPVRALAVDNEPSPFWMGENEAELVEKWKAARFDEAGGTVVPAGGLNGSSGRWVVEHVLPAFDVEPEDVWFTDCLDTYRASDGQRERLDDTYSPFAAAHGLPMASLLPHPSESQIVAEAVRDHLERLREELATASPTVVVTVGNAAARVFHAIVELDGDATGLPKEGYGETQVVHWQDRAIQWVPLIHPGAPPGWKKIHERWLEDQRIVEGEVLDEEPGGGRPPRMLARRLLTAGANVPKVLATEAVKRLSGPALERAREARAREPEASTEELVKRTIQRTRQLARAEGAIAGLSLTASEITSVFGTAGTLTVPAIALNLGGDLTALAWIQTRMVLEIAALHGRKMGDHSDLVKDVIQLWAPHEATVPLVKPIGGAIQRVSKRLLERYLRGAVLVSVKQLFRVVGINFSRAAVVRALPGVNVVANVAVNDQSTKVLGKRAHAYFR